MVPDVAFERMLEHGFCVGVHLPQDDGRLESLAEPVLAAEERACASVLPSRRRRTWLGGRVAMRVALARAGLEAPPVLADDRGAPILPQGIAGSITHKETLAAALVARESGARLGVDLEYDVPRTTDISSRILAADEAEEVAALDAASRGHEVLVRFSAKEALYKAIDPFVRRYVGFKEVSVSPRPDGTARVALRLHPDEGPFAADVRWYRFDAIVLTTARVLLVR